MEIENCLKQPPKWVFPKIVVPQNGWIIMENPIKMDDVGVPLFSETSKYQSTYQTCKAKLIGIKHQEIPEAKIKQGKMHMGNDVEHMSLGKKTKKTHSENEEAATATRCLFAFLIWLWHALTCWRNLHQVTRAVPSEFLTYSTFQEAISKGT